MLLAVNVGNTNTVFGVFDGDELRWSWRISTQPTRTADELGVVLAGLLDQAGLSFTTKITGVAISSVVPPSTTAFREMVETYFSFPALVVEPGVRTGVPILTDNPREVGSDRIVNALAAFERHGGPCIVIDFGTAVTFDILSADKHYIGGVIAPGVNLSAEALHQALRLGHVCIGGLRVQGRTVGLDIESQARRQSLERIEAYHTPLDAAAQSALETAFDSLAEGAGEDLVLAGQLGRHGAGTLFAPAEAVEARR